MRDTDPVAWRFDPGVPSTQALIAVCRTQVGILKNQMSYGQLAVGARSALGPRGEQIRVTVMGGVTQVRVSAAVPRPQPVVQPWPLMAGYYLNNLTQAELEPYPVSVLTSQTVVAGQTLNFGALALDAGSTEVPYAPGAFTAGGKSVPVPTEAGLNSQWFAMSGLKFAGTPDPLYPYSSARYKNASAWAMDQAGVDQGIAATQPVIPARRVLVQAYAPLQPDTWALQVGPNKVNETALVQPAGAQWSGGGTVGAKFGGAALVTLPWVLADTTLAFTAQWGTGQQTSDVLEVGANMIVGIYSPDVWPAYYANALGYEPQWEGYGYASAGDAAAGATDYLTSGGGAFMPGTISPSPAALAMGYQANWLPLDAGLDAALWVVSAASAPTANLTFYALPLDMNGNLLTVTDSSGNISVMPWASQTPCVIPASGGTGTVSVTDKYGHTRTVSVTTAYRYLDL